MIVIPIQPKPKQSVRFSRTGSFQPREIRNYVDALRWYIRSQHRQPPTDQPLSIGITYYFQAAKSMKKADIARLPLPHVKRPDLDNLTKPVLDAMAGIVFIDDSQVCELFLAKKTDEKARIEIIINYF